MTAGTSDPDRPLCTVLTDCTPGVIVAFEKLYSPDDATSEAEFDRLVTAMERPGLPLIEEEARHCVVKVTKDKKFEFTNGWDDRNRDGKGHDFEDKSWPTELLEEMVSFVARLLWVCLLFFLYLNSHSLTYLLSMLLGCRTDPVDWGVFGDAVSGRCQRAVLSDRARRIPGRDPGGPRGAGLGG